jgi:acyl dehydratase
MSTSVDPSALTVGQELPPVTETIERLDLIRYAGASGDFNVIHWNDEVAKAVGLPGVIAHGMYSMGVAARLLSAAAHGPGAVRRFKVRFSAMIQPGQRLTVRGRVAELRDGTAVLDLWAEDDQGNKVLSKGEAELEVG